MLGLGDDEFPQLRSRAVQICADFLQFTEALSKHRRFIIVAKEHPWLFDFGPISRLRERLLDPTPTL